MFTADIERKRINVSSECAIINALGKKIRLGCALGQFKAAYL